MRQPPSYSVSVFVVLLHQCPVLQHAYSYRTIQQTAQLAVEMTRMRCYLLDAM